MYNSLIISIEEKDYEVRESFSPDKTNAFSLIQNRRNEIQNFRNSIDRIAPTLLFEGEAGFRRDYEAIKARIAEIKV